MDNLEIPFEEVSASQELSLRDRVSRAASEMSDLLPQLREIVNLWEGGNPSFRLGGRLLGSELAEPTSGTNVWARIANALTVATTNSLPEPKRAPLKALQQLAEGLRPPNLAQQTPISAAFLERLASRKTEADDLNRLWLSGLAAPDLQTRLETIESAVTLAKATLRFVEEAAKALTDSQVGKSLESLAEGATYKPENQKVLDNALSLIQQHLDRLEAIRGPVEKTSLFRDLILHPQPAP